MRQPGPLRSQQRLSNSAGPMSLSLLSLLLLCLSSFSRPILASDTPQQSGKILLIDDDAPALAAGFAVEDDGLNSPRPAMYEPEFAAFDRGILGRAPAGVTGLANNVPMQLNIVPGTTQYFVLEKSVVSSNKTTSSRRNHDELRRRADDDKGDDDDGADDEDTNERIVYVTANTCMQPQPLPAVSGTATEVEAPQLTLYVSTSTQNTSPGPQGLADSQQWYVFTEGAVMASFITTNDVYLGISAPNISSTLLSGVYNMEVAASVDDYYHQYDNETDANLIWVDSDSSSTLLITHNLTDSTDAAEQETVMNQQPYVMFAQNANDSAINGVRFSYCGLQTYAQIAATKNGKFTSMVTTSMTRRGQGNLPKQQFYFSGLNASSNYVGILAALPGNGTETVGGAGVVNGGGIVSRATNFTTKQANGNCEVVYNLTFCNETAYAVPGNPNRFTNATQLAAVYDQYAADMYDSFTKAMAQIPCEAPLTQRYSLVRGCNDCAAAYKRWLCSVAMPRCSDFSDQDAWLQPRAISQPFPNGTMLDPAIASLYRNISAFNSSRNPFIDETITPGPYKEVLPCDDLCYQLVQSCPASLGFGCPQQGHIGFNTSYGIRTEADENGYVTCNYPGSAHYFSASPPKTSSPIIWIYVLAITVGAILVS